MPDDAVPALIRLFGREAASGVWTGTMWLCLVGGIVLASIGWLALITLVLLADYLRRKG
jgi:hypothetical protein